MKLNTKTPFTHDTTTRCQSQKFKPFEQPVEQTAASCKQAFNRLLNRLFNRFDNRLNVCLHYVHNIT